ncbi:MAG: ATP-binding protein [Microbacteriaceae bacterium]|nr:ATP-binding protein [Microbacteriaceae bacterium]
MNAVLEDNALAVAGAAALLLVLAIVFLVLWLVTRHGRAKQHTHLIEVERERLELQGSLQEQLGHLRIVREMHEIIIPSVSAIISTAEGAGYAAEEDPGAAVRSASQIAEAARTTLADLRRVMSIVGDDDPVAAELVQPRLDMIRDLVNVTSEEGIKVELVESGERFDLKEGAELVLFRIAEEALDNARTYGGHGTEVRISISWTEQGVQLLVDDDGIRAEARRQGLDPNEVSQQRGYTAEDDLNALTQVVNGPGISEMRERAELFGGIVNAYSVPGVGFSVSAIFPALKYDNGVHGVNLGAK